jgi:hypothetical protein
MIQTSPTKPIPRPIGAEKAIKPSQKAGLGSILFLSDDANKPSTIGSDNIIIS